MIDARIKRWVGSVAAGALALSGATLALAGPATAVVSATGGTLVSQSDVRSNEVTYKGWHEGYPNSAPAYYVGWNGLHLGLGAHSQIINGLVDAGKPGLEVTATKLAELITGSTISVTSGEVFAQVAVTTDSGWGTLRPAVAAKTSTAAKASDLWTSSKKIGDVLQDTPTPLSSIISSLGTQVNLRYSAFGVLALTPANVSAMTWDGASYAFGPKIDTHPVTTSAPVTADLIRSNENTYIGWHEGYPNAKPAFSVAQNGLHLGDGANSQIINGLAVPIDDADLASLITSSALSVASGAVSFQVPLYFGATQVPQPFTTLRPAANATDGTTKFSLSDSWVTSYAIPLTTTTQAFAKGASAPLGDLIDALEAQTSVQVLGFGVLAMSVEPSVVSSVVWNGTDYSFVASATQTVLLGSPSSTYGAGVEYTAQVRAGTANAVGEVEFSAGSKVLGKAVLADGKATFTVKDLPVGASSITAKFLGSPSYLASTGTVSHAVTVASAIVSNASVGAALVGDDVTLNLAVKSSGGVPTGDVVIRTYAAELGTVTLDAEGKATFTVTNIRPDMSRMYAIYEGSSQYADSVVAIDIDVTWAPATGTPVQIYVKNVYRDLFSRNPDPTGLSDWTAELNSGTSRSAVANGITYSTEYRAGLIGDSYLLYLGRTAETAGLTDWLDEMSAGVTVSQMQSGFIASDEYFARAGGSDSLWVEALYADVLGRDVGASEVSAWTKALANGASRQQVAMGFLLSTEHLNNVVANHYQALLGRGLDAVGQAGWVGILQAGGRDEAIIAGIVASDEYFALT